MNRTFENAKVGDKVWDFIYGWGNIINVIEDSPFPIMADFGNGRTISYEFDGKSYDTDINPRLFWDEIKFEIPEKPLNLEDELKNLEVVEFKTDDYNYYLYWNNRCELIGYDYVCQDELIGYKYFSISSINTFMENIIGKNITKEEFFKAYRNVFGGRND